MLTHALDIGKSWLSSTRKRQPVYQQRLRSGDSTELQTLTIVSTKSNFGLGSNTEYGPHTPDAHSQTSFVSAKKKWARRLFGEQFTGWRFGALHFAVWASVVFIINVIVTIWGSESHHANRGILFEGDCDRVKQLNTALHVLINILSTILLSGSNYCMQCLSAPTRGEVDKAHAKGRWLDIGIPSLRNVRHLSWQRIALWVLFGLTSIPLHLFYNSAVFGSLSSNSYYAIAVSKSFIEDTECLNCTAPINAGMAIYRNYWETRRPSNGVLTYERRDITDLLQDLHSNARNLDRLEPAECLNQYSSSIQSKRRNLLVVASDDKFPTAKENTYINGSHVYWASPFYSDDAQGVESAANSYNWICSGLKSNTNCANNLDAIRANLDAWRVGLYCPDGLNTDRRSTGGPYVNCQDGAFPVEYCLSQHAQPHCRLQFDTTISVIVTILNFVKAALMFFVAFRIRDEPFITMGDAVASFLAKSDPTTKNMCLLSLHDIKKNGYQAGPREWLNKQFKWKDVTSKKRRATTILMFLFALAVVGALLGWGVRSLPGGTPRSLSALARLGFGAVDPRTAIVVLKNDLVFNVIIANSPQVILSFLYFCYNALFTAFLLSHEWTTYAHKRKGLRVSRQPVGAQRMTYFLQLPYRFGVPLMVLSGTLHWLVSQSIFLLAVDFYDIHGNYGSGRPDSDLFDMKTCGYSPIAIISVIILGSIMTIAIVAFGFVPYKRGMTLAGSCSLAISAACHLDKRVDVDGDIAAVGKLQWGVVGVTEDGVGHCGFSTKSVKAPVVGEVYSGERT